MSSLGTICLAEHFWPRVAFSDGCWEWTGSRDLPPETRESLSSLFIGVVGILLVAFALLWLLPGVHL